MIHGRQREIAGVSVPRAGNHDHHNRCCDLCRESATQTLNDLPWARFPFTNCQLVVVRFKSGSPESTHTGADISVRAFPPRCYAIFTRTCDAIIGTYIIAP